MRVAVILPAAGLGTRFAAGGGSKHGSQGESAQPALQHARTTKIEYRLGGQPVFLRAVELFVNHPDVVQTILAVHPDRIDDFTLQWGDKLGFHGVKIVPGGRVERWETVLKAIDALSDDCTHVAVHDAARPLTSRKLIDRVFEAAQQFAAVIPGYPVHATLKHIEAYDDPQPADDHSTADPLDAILVSTKPDAASLKQVVRTVDRTHLVEAQTPQVFEAQLLRRAYAALAQGDLDGSKITDDAELVQRLGQRVVVVDGDAMNLKITRPDDLPLAEAVISATQKAQTASLGRKRLFVDDDE